MTCAGLFCLTVAEASKIKAAKNKDAGATAAPADSPAATTVDDPPVAVDEDHRIGQGRDCRLNAGDLRLRCGNTITPDTGLACQRAP